MKKTFIYITIFFAAAMFVKCNKASEGIIYNYSIFSSSFANNSDSIKVAEYIKPKKIVKVISIDKKIEAADNEAIETFDKLAEKLSVAELDDLKLAPATTFTFAVSRWQQPSNPYSGIKILKEFSYP